MAFPERKLTREVSPTISPASWLEANCGLWSRNGTQTKYGSLTETWRQMSEYKEGFWRRNCYQNNPPKIEIRDYLILAEF